MILTCPNCSTRFVIDPSALGEEGRTVRCGACAYSWFQEPALAPEEPYEPPPLNLDDVITTPLDRDAEGREKRRLWPRLLAWFLFIFLIGAIAAGGYRFRQEIVDRWPPAVKIYDFLGVDIKPPTNYGLVVPAETVRAGRESANNTAILVISGDIVNRGSAPQKVGRMLITLLDKEGSDAKELRRWIFTPEARTLNPGSKMSFRTSITDPPAGAKSVRFKFILGD